MSVREYVGARYVPKFSDKNNGDWDNTYSYEALEIVKYGNDYYTAKIPVPVGEAITDTTYWVLTGNYNGAISTLTARVAALETDVADITNLKWYNIADYGMEPGDNIYDDLYDLLWDHVHPGGGGVVYFPRGRYTLDYTILIPENTIFMGEGDATQIIFDLTDTYLGAAFITGGPNITIRDMVVEPDSNAAYAVRGSLPNGIGISDVDFESLVTKRSHVVSRRSGIRNIHIENVNAPNANYCIQIEPDIYTVKDIFISNHCIPNGMFSIEPTNGGGRIENVYVDNLICDTCRIGAGNLDGKNININGLTCTQLLAMVDDVNITNFKIESGAGNRLATSIYYAITLVAAGKNINLVNGLIRHATASPQTRFLYVETLPTNIYACNVNLSKESDAYTNANYTEYAEVEEINCNIGIMNPQYNALSNPAAAATASIPTVVNFSENKGCSHVSGCFVYDGSADMVIGELPTPIKNNPRINRNASGLGMVYTLSGQGAAITPIPIAIVLKPLDGKIHALANAANTYTTPSVILFSLDW